MWTRDEALEFYKALLSPMAQEYGFSAAIYGSVLLDDRGKDLDIFMVPQKADADMQGFVARLRRSMRSVNGPIAGDWNRDVVIATTVPGKQIDIQFTRL